MKERLHVLVIPTWYPNGKDKLIGIYHKTFCKALVEDGKVDVNMLYIDRQGIRQLPKYPFMKKRYDDVYEGYTVYIRRMMSVSKLGYKMQVRAYTKALEKLFKEYVKINGRPDVIHAHVAVPAGYAAAVIGKKYGIPVMVTEHAFRHFSYPDAKDYVDFVMENTRFTCVSEYLRTMLKEKHNISAEILANVVDTAVFNKPRQPKEDGVFRLVTVSALRPGKCVDDTIKALKILRDNNEIGKFEFTVVGNGEAEDIYRQAMDDLNMNDVVSFVGRKTPEEASEYLSCADALVIASNIETFGIPAIEALAAGVPVVTTRCKGPEGFLDEKCAEFCEIENPEDLARAIKRMYDRRGTFDEDYLRSVADRFGSKSIAEQAYEMYKELADKE